MLEEFKNVFAVAGYRDGANGSNPPVLSLAVGRRVHQLQRAELVKTLGAVLGVQMDAFGSSETLAEGEENEAVARYMGASPLHLAAEMGSLEMVQALVKQNANVRPRRANIDGTPNDAGVTPLELAACNGHVDVVRELYDAGASLLVSSGDEVAGYILFEAIKKSDLRLAQFFFKYNEELNCDTLKQLVDRDNRTLAEVVEEKLAEDSQMINEAIHFIVIEALKSEAEKLQERQETSAATAIQAQVRGMQARATAMDAAEGEAAIEGEDGDDENVKQADEAGKANDTVAT